MPAAYRIPNTHDALLSIFYIYNTIYIIDLLILKEKRWIWRGTADDWTSRAALRVPARDTGPRRPHRSRRCQKAAAARFRRRSGTAPAAAGVRPWVRGKAVYWPSCRVRISGLRKHKFDPAGRTVRACRSPSPMIQPRRRFFRMSSRRQTRSFRAQPRSFILPRAAALWRCR